MGERYKVGVRFCGGCNCYFDRKALYENLRKQLSASCAFFHYTEEDSEKMDLILLINGCQSECLLTASYDADILLINNKNYESAEALIKECLKLNKY